MLKSDIKELKDNVQKLNANNFKMQCSNIIRDIKIQKTYEKYERLLNSYKILYFRKIANIILDALIKNHKEFLYKTRDIFCDSNKPLIKRNMFGLIISKEKINEVNMNSINLLIDFLMYVKDIAPSIIHLVEKFPVQIEILFNIFGKEKIKKEGENYIINSLELINTLFSEQKQSSEADEINNIENKVNNENSNKRSNYSDIFEDEQINQTNKIIKEIDEKYGNSSSSSDNFISTNEEKIIHNNQIITSENYSNQIDFDYKEERDNNDKVKETCDKKINSPRMDYKIKIEDITKELDEYEENENFSISEMIQRIEQIDLENILSKEGKKLNQNELIKLKCLKKFKDDIRNSYKENDNIEIIDGNFIFKKWKNSFKRNYKADISFKKLVIFNRKLTLDEIKKVAINLIGSLNLEIFVEDPGNFASKIENVLEKKEFDSYNKKLLKN
jgi:hypothetical protein